MTYDKENVIQTKEGDTLTIGVDADTFLLSMFGNTPRTYNKGTFNKEELKKLGAIIARLTNE